MNFDNYPEIGLNDAEQRATGLPEHEFIASVVHVIAHKRQVGTSGKDAAVLDTMDAEIIKYGQQNPTAGIS